MQKTALITSGIVFGLLAISHAIRWLSPVEILVNGNILSFQSIRVTRFVIFFVMRCGDFLCQLNDFRIAAGQDGYTDIDMGFHVYPFFVIEFVGF